MRVRCLTEANVAIVNILRLNGCTKVLVFYVYMQKACQPGMKGLFEWYFVSWLSKDIWQQEKSTITQRPLRVAYPTQSCQHHPLVLGRFLFFFYFLIY